MDDQKRIRVDFNNGEQRMMIYMTEEELKRMLCKKDAWDALQSDVDSLRKSHNRSLFIYTVCFILMFASIFALAIGLCELRVMIGG